MRVLYYGVHDAAYPRNTRIRAYLVERLGARVEVVARRRTGSRVRRAAADLRGLWLGSRGVDVVVLAEMRVSHAPLGWLVSRLRGARFVVDRLVGLHETAVVDWRSVAPRSPAALRLVVLDRLALRLADLVLIDTEMRADELRRVSRAAPVVALPVGAPRWARDQPPAPPSETLRVLYYGNYIPLHGTELVLEALALVLPRRAVRLTLIGGGPRRAGIERLVDRLGLGAACRFVDAVPESALVDAIGANDVVLGVFGDSAKARSVVANKVWQGLACGRTVVTQRSPALAELQVVAGSLLVQTEPGDAHALADALVGVVPRTIRADLVAPALDELVDRGFAGLEAHLRVPGRSS